MEKEQTTLLEFDAFEPLPLRKSDTAVLHFEAMDLPTLGPSAIPFYPIAKRLGVAHYGDNDYSKEFERSSVLRAIYRRAAAEWNVDTNWQADKVIYKAAGN